MIEKCLIIKHCAFANTGFVTELLSKFKQVTSLSLNYRPITLDFSQSYKEQAWCTCWGFQKSLANLVTHKRRYRRRRRIEQLVRCDRISDWEKKWIQSIQRLKDLSPKQLEIKEKIESKVGGLK